MIGLQLVRGNEDFPVLPFFGVIFLGFQVGFSLQILQLDFLSICPLYILSSLSAELWVFFRSRVLHILPLSLPTEKL